MMNLFGKIMSSLEMVGTDMPAYKALFDSLMDGLNETDQKILKQTYAESLERAEEAHQRAQSL